MNVSETVSVAVTASESESDAVTDSVSVCEYASAHEAGPLRRGVRSASGLRVTRLCALAIFFDQKMNTPSATTVDHKPDLWPSALCTT